MRPLLDHIAIGAADLTSAIDSLAQDWGVRIPTGGKHRVMATHNGVMQSRFHPDPEAACYIELIASDPDAPPPQRPRWFSLDEGATKTRLAQGPAALCWVVRCDNIDDRLAALPDELRAEMGPVISMSRGTLNWRLTVPETGRLAQGGLLPVFIEWPAGPHVSLNQANLGVSIGKIEISTPEPDALKERLACLDVLHLVEVRKGTENLSFHLDIPGGETKILRRN